MSDMSTPPMSMVRPRPPSPAAAMAQPSRTGFAWPVPAGGAYGGPSALIDAEPAELEGPNGTVTLCRLMIVDAAAGTVSVQTSNTRRSLTLKLAQFKRLTLLRPLKPLAGLGRPTLGQLQLAHVSYVDGQISDVKSIGHVESALGHFIFSPLNKDGDLLRSFYPRPMVKQITHSDPPRSAQKRPGPSGAGMDFPAGPAQPQANPAQAMASTISQAQSTARLKAAGKAIDPDLPRLAGTLPDFDFQLDDMPTTGHASAGKSEMPQGASSGPSHAPAPASNKGLGLPPLAMLAKLPELTLALDPTQPEAPALPVLPMLQTLLPGPLATPQPMAATATTGHLPTLGPLPELDLALSLRDEPAAKAAHADRPSMLEDLLQLEQITTPARLLAAIDQQARMPMVRIGEALIALGYLTEQKLADALQLQARDRSLPLGELLVRKGQVTRADLQTALARKMGYPIVDVMVFPVDKDAALRMPLSVARRLPALPLMMTGGRMVVALEDPTARQLIDEIEFTSQCKVVPVLAPSDSLQAAIEMVYLRLGKETIEPSAELKLSFHTSDADASSGRLLATLEQDTAESTKDEGPLIEQSDNSLVRLINTMITEARQMGVSDIHVECLPSPQKVKVRFRKDGVLRPYIELPPNYRQAVVARLKIMCDLDISERRKPQDGKIAFGRFVQGDKLELRVATIPTANGLEDVVMRLLASSKALPLGAMGLQPDILSQLRAAVERPYGLVLCVGPTGSGKTTTLHAALGHINTAERKIWTAEDPVEITQPGLRQVQVNPKIDWTFAKALRAFLRADPDVVMVGEVRDAETAQMAIEASLTGHLVLSTLHTNSAPETLTRLLDMGMDPFSFSDSLLAVLAQRLVRRWCKHCVTVEPADEEEQQALVTEYRRAYADEALRPPPDQLLAHWRQQFGKEGVLMHHHAPGCSRCNKSGFDGRLGLHELLVVDREIRHLIQSKATPQQLQAEAMRHGMRTLRQDGILKVLAGLTSIEEVRATSNL